MTSLGFKDPLLLEKSYQVLFKPTKETQALTDFREILSSSQCQMLFQ